MLRGDLLRCAVLRAPRAAACSMDMRPVHERVERIKTDPDVRLVKGVSPFRGSARRTGERPGPSGLAAECGDFGKGRDAQGDSVRDAPCRTGREDNLLRRNLFQTRKRRLRHLLPVAPKDRTAGMSCCTGRARYLPAKAAKRNDPQAACRPSDLGPVAARLLCVRRDGKPICQACGSAPRRARAGRCGSENLLWIGALALMLVWARQIERIYRTDAGEAAPKETTE